MLCVAACAPTSESQAGATQTKVGPIAGTWMDVEVEGESVILPLDEVVAVGNAHFSLTLDERKMDFMAYVLGDVLHVRANACPPCRSVGYALDGDTLVCDMCQTTFEAGDGSGIEGACVDYPKAAADYSIEGGLIVMTSDELVRAYDETLVAG